MATCSHELSSCCLSPVQCSFLLLQPAINWGQVLVVVSYSNCCSSSESSCLRFICMRSRSTCCLHDSPIYVSHVSCRPSTVRLMSNPWRIFPANTARNCFICLLAETRLKCPHKKTYKVSVLNVVKVSFCSAALNCLRIGFSYAFRCVLSI